MAADNPFFHSSMAIATGYALYYAVDGSRLFILPLVNRFRDVLCATSVHQQLSRWFARCFAQQMVLLCSFFHLSMAFTVCVLYWSVESSALLILLLEKRRRICWFWPGCRYGRSGFVYFYCMRAMRPSRASLSRSVMGLPLRLWWRRALRS